MKFILGFVLLAMASLAPASGWLVKVDGDYTRHDQCNVLTDSVGTLENCTYRLSVMCLLDGVGSAASVSNNGSPVVLPYTLLLLSMPDGPAVGYITIVSLPTGGNATIGLNGATPTSDWVLSASYAGRSCGAPVSDDGGATPSGNSQALARFCQQHPDVPACRGR